MYQIGKMLKQLGWWLEYRPQNMIDEHRYQQTEKKKKQNKTADYM